MPSILEGGLLDGDAAPGSTELPPWQTANFEAGAGAMTAPVKRNLRWLRNLCWPSRSSAAAGGNGSGNGTGARKLRPTAYLDGLRGFAAFLVYIHHHELWAHSIVGTNDILENAYGYKDRYYFAALPFIRNFFTGGHMAVATFYVISGYVLSAKALSLTHSGEYSRLLDSLASSVFRRWFRLFIPIIVTTFVYVNVLHAFSIWTASFDYKGSLHDEYYEWYVELKNYSFLFKEGATWMSCNMHLWSIPLEMRGSIIVFCAALSLCHASNRARHLSLLGLIIYFLYIADGYYGSLFVMGMLQCDLDMMAQRDDPEFPGFLRALEPHKKTIYYILLTCGMYLNGVPAQTTKLEDLRANPGWYWLSFLKPQAVFDPKWFYLFFAASFTVAAVPRIPWIRRFCESNFCQYLGRISYSLYLVHGPIIWTFGERVYAMVGWIRPSEVNQQKLAPYLNLFPLPRVGPMGLEISLLLPHIFLLPFTLWVADLVTRFVDEPTVRFSNWFYKKTLASRPMQPKPEDAQRLA